MNSKFLWLVLVEVIILVIFIIIKIILATIERQKINKILKFIEKKSQKDGDIESRFSACLEELRKSRGVDLK